MENMNLAPHEALEVREFITQEILEVKKVTTSMDMVNDIELKNYMQDLITNKKTALKNIRTALETKK